MDHLRLHPDTIEAVKQRSDIVEIVSEQVALKKQGKDLIGFCPFHDDKKTPSFSVSPSKQFYYCFSCNAGGDAISFLMGTKKSSFTEVVLGLAQRYDVPVQAMEPEQTQQLVAQTSRRSALYEVLAVAARFYEHCLRQPEGSGALAYLNDRGLRDQTIQQFQLGYAPGGWATLFTYLVEQRAYSPELVEQAGLALKRKGGDGYYDRFRDRLMIPICDQQGRVIAFGGRTLSGQDPKYINSPETELFEKGRTLYALHQASAAIAKHDRAVVVEGYFDVIALHAVGVTNVVAAQGTALSQAQVKLLLRYTDSKRIVLNFDADRAGAQATGRAIAEVEVLAYQGQVELRVLRLPEGKDADEYLQRSSASQYQSLLANAPLWLDWQIEQAIEGKNLRQADVFTSVCLRFAELLHSVTDAPTRTHYLRHCAELLGRGDARLSLQLESDLRSQLRTQPDTVGRPKLQISTESRAQAIAEAQLLRIYLHCPPSRLAIHTALHQRSLGFGILAHDLIWQQILQIEEAHLGAAAMVDPTQIAAEDLAAIDLQDLLHPGLTAIPAEVLPTIMRIIVLDELTAIDTQRPEQAVPIVVATLERLTIEQDSDRLLQELNQQAITSLETCLDHLLSNPIAMVDGIDQIQQVYQKLNDSAYKCQEVFLDHHRRLRLLDRHRCGDFSRQLN